MTLSIPVFLVLAGCHSADSYFKKGNDLFARGQFADASLNYRKAIQGKADLGAAYYGAGLADMKQNKAAASLQDFEQAIRLMPDNPAPKMELANLMLGSYIGDPQRPKFLYDLLLKFSGQWLAQDPNSMPGLRIQGYIAMLEQRPDEAVSVFRRAHQLYPRDEKTVDGLMDSLFRANQPAEAERVGLDFLALDGTAADVYDALYRVYVAAHRVQDAENILTRKVKANPKQNSYLLQLAGFYAGAHKQPEVDRTMRMFLANPGNDPVVHLQAGDFYNGIGDFADALQEYRAGDGADRKDQLLYQKRIARVFLLQKNTPEALQALNQTLAQYPDDTEARTLRAVLLVSQPAAGKPGEGIQELRSLVAKNPQDLVLKFSLARSLAESHNLGEARTQLLEIAKLEPEFLDAHILLADIAFQRGDMFETLQQAEAALGIDPENLRARMLQGSALLRQGNLYQAGAVFGSLSRQMPESVDVRLQLAYVKLKQRNYFEAEAAFNKILAGKPSEWRAVAGLVDSNLAQHHADKAFSRLDAELARSHGSPAIRYLLATTALRNGKYDVAIQNFQELAKQTSNSIDAQIQLAEAFRLKGDVHDAILTLEQAAALEPKDPRPAALLPRLLQTDNRAQEAKQLLRRALAERPDDANGMNNLAFLLAQTGDSMDEALRLARRAVQKAPNNPAYLDTLGYVYLKRQDTDEALDIFSKLIRKYPDDPACAFHTGMAWYQKGDRARAKTFLSRALELHPPNDIESGATALLSRFN